MTLTASARHALVTLGLLFPMTLAGCAPAPPASVPEDSSSRIFSGTPDEYVVVLRGCFEDAGLKTVDPENPADPGFGIDLTDGRSPVERDEIRAECEQSIGQPKISSLSVEELRARYENRVAQSECLRANGLTDELPISFEVFQSEYERSGQSVLWEPTEGLEPQQVNGTIMGPTDVCPRSGSTW